MGQPIRVLLVDDYKIMSDALAKLLNSRSDMEVVGQASNGFEAIEVARRLRPNVILMDINMPGMNGIEATSTICAEFPEIHIIGLSMFEDEIAAKRMRKAGAVGYIRKGAPLEQLIAVIRSCAAEK
jgi:DNA-binding NarL/FixJ family response regulator